MLSATFILSYLVQTNRPQDARLYATDTLETRMADVKSLLNTIREQIEEIDAAQARERLADNAILIDVREGTETADGIIPGSRLIPRGFLELRVEDQILNRNREIILMCAGGTRSLFAARSLKELGYSNVKSLEGGFRAWKNAGFGFEVPKTLTSEELTRYSRHLLIPEVGEEGQKKLLDAKVLLLGAGGIGCPLAYYLAAAGVGTIGIIDSDIVDRSNLQRQILHTEDRIGMPKVDSARIALEALNPDIEIVTYNERLTADNVLEIFEGYDIVADGGDNFPTRYLVNDACVHLGIPNVTGSVFRFEGQVTVLKPHDGPCYRCLYPEPPPAEFAPSCQEAGVLGVLPGIIGLLQGVEVMKLIVGFGEPLIGKLLMYNALDQSFRKLRIRRDNECKMCGDNATFTGFTEYEQFCRFDG